MVGHMEQSFLEKLKRVRIGDLLHIFKFIGAFFVAFFYKRQRKNLWLLCDNQVECRDNAYWLFKYLKEHTDEDAVFAISKKSPDYERVSCLGEVIDYGSFKHWVYYLSAKYNISSQKLGKPNAAICYVLEVYGIIKNTRIFLQHGIITADLSFLYYEHTKMRMFVTSTYDEWKYVNDNYHYPDGYVKELGLCRFDNLHDINTAGGTQVKKNKILIMPTWRMYIRNEIAGENSGQLFKDTEYYKGWNSVISDKKLIDYVKENNLEIIFFPHREMHNFIEYFDIEDSCITLAAWPEYDVATLLKECAILVTDFSSVAMDFAYMKKPLIYYQFDNEKFRASHHQQGYFDFKKDGFGPVVVTADEVRQEVIKAHKNGFENDEKYLKRHEEYFDLWDDNNCRRNYEAIKEI